MPPKVFPIATSRYPVSSPVVTHPTSPSRVARRERLPTMSESWLNRALEALQLPTSPFHERYVLDWVSQQAEAAGLTAVPDACGNLVIDLPGPASDHAVPLLLSAHADHPGFWAGPMTASRTLVAHWIGRVPERYFAKAAVRFWVNRSEAPTSVELRSVRGRISRVLEYRGEGDYAKVQIETDGIVPPGSIGQWDLPEVERVDRRLHATAIDDVAGVAAMMCVMQALAAREISRPVRLLITRAEEAGFVGCMGYCRDQVAAGRRGTAQIVGIEMSKAMPEAPVGSGPIVRVGDRRSIFDAATTADCARAADNLAQRDPSFRYQRRLMPGGTCESSVFQSMLGRSGAVCLPLGNYHNVDESRVRLDREYIDLDDFTQLVQLLIEITETPASTHEPDHADGAWCRDLWDRHKHLLHDATSSPKKEGA